MTEQVGIREPSKKNSSNGCFTGLVGCSGTIIILILLAIPTFLDASNKAKQVEASTLLAGYLKASQAYFTENQMLPKSSKDLGEYVTILSCNTKNKPKVCIDRAPIDLSNVEAKTWYTPSGNYEIEIEAYENIIYFFRF